MAIPGGVGGSSGVQTSSATRAGWVLRAAVAAHALAIGVCAGAGTGLCAAGSADAGAPAGCPASASWFSSPSMPTEIAGGTNANNCDFHQFAWQAFIDLVQPVSGSPGLRTFETYMPDYGIFVPANTPVTPWGQQPSAPCGGATADAKLGKHLFLRPRVAKGAGFDPDSDKQATLPGETIANALYDQNNQVVYYSIWVNQTEYDFITHCNFNDTGCITSAPATTAITAGAIELKGSWRAFNGPAPKDMYSIRGVIGVKAKDGSTSCKAVTLGLVGFHLVTNTPTHPEFIWATFEHKSNAPDCVNPQKPPPGGWSFNNPKCPASQCPPNQPDQPNTKPKANQVCRVAPQGGGDATNVGNIRAINASVHQTLAGLLKTAPAQYRAMAIWQNYDLTGNLWTLNGQLPPVGPQGPNGGNERGSLLAANTTLETFAQGQSAKGVDQNCFTCHTQAQFVTSAGVKMGFPPGAPANFSHLWGVAQRPNGCNAGKGPLPATCPVKAGKSAAPPAGATKAPAAPAPTK
jgi:hypothetical protein